MAQTITCDTPGCEEIADVMITYMSLSETQAYCNAHYAELVFAIAAKLAESDLESVEPTEKKESKGKRKHKEKEPESLPDEITEEDIPEAEE